MAAGELERDGPVDGADGAVADPPGTEYLAGVCYPDAFFVHLRLLIEFLISKPRRDLPPAITLRDYAKVSARRTHSVTR